MFNHFQHFFISDPCIPEVCNNNGICKTDGSCMCDPNWSGATCNIDGESKCIIIRHRPNYLISLRTKFKLTVSDLKCRVYTVNIKTSQKICNIIQASQHFNWIYMSNEHTNSVLSKVGDRNSMTVCISGKLQICLAC